MGCICSRRESFLRGGLAALYSPHVRCVLSPEIITQSLVGRGQERVAWVIWTPPHRLPFAFISGGGVPSGSVSVLRSSLGESGVGDAVSPTATYWASFDTNTMRLIHIVLAILAGLFVVCTGQQTTWFTGGGDSRFIGYYSKGDTCMYFNFDNSPPPYPSQHAELGASLNLTSTHSVPCPLLRLNLTGSRTNKTRASLLPRYLTNTRNIKSVP